MNAPVPSGPPDDKKPWFHTHEGWYFCRLDDGSVKVKSPTGAHIMIPPVWGSVVASVSKTGETRESWIAAQKLHDGATPVVSDEARERAAKVLFDLFGDDYEWTELGEQDKQQYRNAVDAVLDAKGEPFAVPLKPSLLKKHDAALKGEPQGGNK